MWSDEFDKHLNPDVSALIETLGIPAMIRAVTAHCRAEYERRSKLRWNDSSYSGYTDFDAAPEPIRREFDETSALLQVSQIDYAADNFEKAMNRVGWTHKQECEASRAEEIIQTRAKLESLESKVCA